MIKRGAPRQLVASRRRVPVAGLADSVDSRAQAAAPRLDWIAS